VSILLNTLVLKGMYGLNYVNNYRTRESRTVHDDEAAIRTAYEFHADETTFYFVAFCVSFAVCMALSNDGKHRRRGSRFSMACATALVSCGIVGIALAGFDVVGTPIHSPWPGLGGAAILGALKEKVYTVGWDVLKQFFKGKFSLTIVQSKGDDK